VHPLNKKFIHSEFLRYYEAPPRFSFALTFKTGIIASFDYSKIVYSIYEHHSLQIRSIIHCNLGQIPTIRSLYFLQGVAFTIIQSQYNNFVLTNLLDSKHVLILTHFLSVETTFFTD